MKMIIRPKNFAYFIIYFFTVLFVVSSIWLMYEYISGDVELSVFELACIIITPFIFLTFFSHFGKVKIIIDCNELIFVKSMWVNRTKEDKFKLSNFLFYQNGKIQKILIEIVALNLLEKYGFTRDLEMDYVEKPPVFAANIFSNQEIIFIMKNNEIKSLNARPYTKKDIKRLKDYIQQQTRIEATGSLNDI